MTALVAICAFSLAGIIFLLAREIYLSRKLTEGELKREIAASQPFFREFEKRLLPIFRSGFQKSYSFFCSRKEFKFIRSYFCRLSDYMNGRHIIKSNGCRGYWNEVNGFKNNNSDTSVSTKTK